MIKYLLALTLLTGISLKAQDECDPYGKHIFDLIVNNDIELKSEFVDLLVRLGVTAYPKMAAGLSLLIVMHLLLIPLQGKSTCATER